MWAFSDVISFSYKKILKLSSLFTVVSVFCFVLYHSLLYQLYTIDLSLPASETLDLLCLTIVAKRIFTTPMCPSIIA